MDFYYLPSSAPCRSVQMLAKALGVDLNLKYLDLKVGAHVTPEFLKINPQHTIPTLVDNGVSVWESRAILIYLAQKYGKDDSLYPKDPIKQAVVNRLLYFDMGTLYQRFGDYFYPQIMAKTPADPEKFKRMGEAVDFLNTFLEGNAYAAGDKLTIADIALVATISTYEATNFDLSKYPNVDKWYKLMQKVVPGIDINQKGIDAFKQYLKDL